MSERLDSPVYDRDLFAATEKPKKSVVQLYRRQFTAAGVALMFVAVALTDRQLHGTGAGLVLYGLGALAIPTAVLGRFWCYVYNSGNRDRVVITEGPYSLCRNPIYMFSILASVGVGLIAQSIVLPIVFAVLVAGFYHHIINGEEAKMSHLHSDTYAAYFSRTQRMIPAFDKLQPGAIKNLPGAKLARKLPKLAGLGLAFPLVEIGHRAGIGLFNIL